MPQSENASTSDRREMREPYPGLRPFLDHEHALLKGRDDQVLQILDRLAKTHFLAIIGGSGSGKSSLIRAGVVPLLRSRAIASAGDYWIPVVSTPGTTKLAAPSAASSNASGLTDAETPVTRLAWKFAQAMRPPGTQAVDPKLHREVAAFFRQGAGFGRLVNSYHHLLPRQGPSTDKARFLFVIDQFEELFHPNNRGSEEARVVVDALIDHFLHPDERVYVVMTMRSEHLADCAAFLRLPDAINRSFYLVRRLNSEEVREVIVEPAQVILRRIQRGDSSRTDPVEFAPEVVARLLADVRRIEDDPDHLPLLQHLLARIWSAAVTREGVSESDLAPRQITMADLEAAVAPGAALVPGWLNVDRKPNTLCDSLENWAEHLYNDRSSAQQVRLERVLRNLAFKDPNSGLYFQQRVDVDDPRLFEGEGQPRSELLDLLKPGFLDTVNYLFWDDENPDHVTLKVSHEAFIRGWTRFRKIIDVEADRFDEFVVVMRRCLLWQDKGRPDTLLLGAAELERIAGAQLNEVIDDPEQRKSWFSALRLYREGHRLSAFESSLVPFVVTSRERQARLRREAQEHEQRITVARETERAALEQARIARAQQEADAIAAEARRQRDQAELARVQADNDRNQAEVERAAAIARRNSVIAWSLAGFGILVVLLGSFTVLTLWPALVSIEQYAAAKNLTESRESSEASPSEDAAERELRTLSSAAGLVTKAALGESIPMVRSSRLREWFNWLPPVASVSRQVMQTSSEAQVVNTLRRLLTTAVWPGTTGASPPLPNPRRETECSLSPSKENGGKVKGSLFLAEEPGYALFVPATTPESREVVLYEAHVRKAECSADRIAFSVPRYLKPLILFDARVALMGVAQQGNQEGRPALSLYEINWEWDNEVGSMVTRIKRPQRVIVDPRAAAVLVEAERQRQPQEQAREVKVVETRRIDGGVAASVGETSWRLLSGNAQPLTGGLDPKLWRKLSVAEEKSQCGRLKPKVWGPMLAENNLVPELIRPRVGLTILDDHVAGQCIGVSSYDGVPEKARRAPAEARTSLIAVSVYSLPAIEAAWAVNPDAKPTPTTVWKFMSLAPDQQREWWLGQEGKFDGWLAATDSHSPSDAIASPFSTAALKRIADDILAPTPASAPASTPAVHSRSPDAPSKRRLADPASASSVQR